MIIGRPWRLNWSRKLFSPVALTRQVRPLPIPTLYASPVAFSASICFWILTAFLGVPLAILCLAYASLWALCLTRATRFKGYKASIYAVFRFVMFLREEGVGGSNPLTPTILYPHHKYFVSLSIGNLGSRELKSKKSLESPCAQAV